MHGQDDETERKRFHSPLARAAEALAWGAGVIATLLVVVILALVSYAVAQRYVMGTPLTWADDLSSYLLIALVSFGAAEALRRGDHIAIDLLSTRQGERGRWLLGIWSNLAVLAFAAVLAWSAWSQAKFAYDFGSFTIDRLELAAWIPVVPLLIGAVLLALLAGVRIAFGRS